MKLPAPAERLVGRLLEHEMWKVATSLKFEPKDLKPLSEIEVVKLANYAEQLSRHAGDDEKTKNLCLAICALLWEHRDTKWDGLPIVLIQAVSRIGLGPTAKMVDPNYDATNDQFSGLGSILSQYRLAANIVESEVEVAEGKSIVLSGFQKDLWNAIDKYRSVGVSAPTSAGKSFVLVNKIVSMLIESPGEVVYIVPTLSLIAQVTSDFKSTIQKFGLTNFSVFQTYSADYEKEHANTIYVLTQERALAAFSQTEKPFQNLQALVVDEIQNLERVSDSGEERAHTLYHVLQEFRTQRPPKIIIAGPRINNIRNLTEDLFGGQSVAISTQSSPVLNLAYAFNAEKEKVVLKQYSTIRREPIKVEIAGADVVSKFGGKQYNEHVHRFIHHLISNLEDSAGTLIFSPTSSQALSTAKALADLLPKKADRAPELKSLREYVAGLVHPDYELVKSLEKGIACHHGKLPLDVRRAIEKAFACQVIKVMTTTTTLMQGVNLPAKHIIARNPFLYLKSGKTSAHLTGYEFANLRGRAGRLMKDVVGRAIVLDETTFDEADISLAELDQKTISHGYKEKFERNRADILDDLRHNRPQNAQLNYLDVEVYIRQMIMRYGDDATTRLYATGIEFTMGEFREIQRQLKTLHVSPEVCAANPYWDPVVLDEIWIAQSNNKFHKIPRNPFDGNLVGTILSTIAHLKEISPFYFNKHINVDHEGLRKAIAITAGKWATEKPLHEIMAERDPKNSKDIHNLLKLISDVIPFKLTRFLSPVVAIQEKGNPILSFIEMGSYKPLTRRLIEIGIGRETAIRLAERIHKAGHNQDDLLKSPGILYSAIIAGAKNLNYWERLQVEDLVLAG
ncbi:MAG: DEAD/DEAH box helicase [Elusimicrobiota bacterium]|jgi:hypothetical protein